jgi:hypothetical protein
MDQKVIDAHANPRQSNIEAETEIRELSFNELDHVAGGTKVEFLQYKFQEVFVS